MTATTTEATAVVGTQAAQQWAAWHAERERDLATPHGWLSLTAYHWLPATPSRLPGLPGLWWADADGAHTRPHPAPDEHGALHGEHVVDGAADAVVAEGASRILGTFLPAGRSPLDADPGATAEIAVELVHRTGRYAVRVRDPHAPALLDFTGVPAFAHDDAWVLDATVRLLEEPREETVGAARVGLVHRTAVVGEIDLPHPGDPARSVTLALTGKPGGATLLLFSDEAEGIAPWRVLWLDLPEVLAPGTESTVRVDLNRTVNLPYAFSDHGTCPAPLPGNHVAFAVTAGEKAPR
ncbi:protein of unknown function DUF1684 [Xylanimonas cellulosilytica DSM 15894]|uniref:DUF1684 domain-containing protein n=1 Tax=Xylanimonas cellulosilytica (strain DSM 15894 / JCM 12276 / CECT 5975 / KCTC 9989 / LMG 20990 / NBRC 107835 / XIL07) TaxID=446471 RepID=D1BZX2_XYLCX|nr:DUF1684 domain-containing protein [Xylanimonas cellulosilytica]ACZ32100.1 protein of unknown function DUF1684 [Xylanimonas cellulosilytica DSM 15894]